MIAGIYLTALGLMLAAGILGVAIAVGIDVLDHCFSKIGAGSDQTRADAATTTRQGMLTQTGADTSSWPDMTKPRDTGQREFFIARSQPTLDDLIDEVKT